MKQRIELSVNGELYEVWISPGQDLLSVIREDLKLTGTKKGCGEGKCGACTVLLDDKPVTACLIPAQSAQGHEVTTIEGLAKNGLLDPIQEAFVEHGAMQCGFCTPGMIMSAKGLLLKGKAVNEDEIKEALSGNLCRCGTYLKIVQAVKSASERDV